MKDFFDFYCPIISNLSDIDENNEDIIIDISNNIEFNIDKSQVNSEYYQFSINIDLHVDFTKDIDLDMYLNDTSISTVFKIIRCSIYINHSFHKTTGKERAYVEMDIYNPTIYNIDNVNYKGMIDDFGENQKIFVKDKINKILKEFLKLYVWNKPITGI